MGSNPPRRYRLVVANRFAKDLKRLDAQVQERVLQALEKIEQNPYQGEKVVAQETGTWRFRVGDWRIIFAADQSEILVLAIAHRSAMYRMES